MNGSATRSRLPAWILSGLMLALPFEARRPAWSVAGLQFTSLEIVAGAAMLLLALALRASLRPLLARPPLPLAGLVCFALAQFAAAALAPAHRQAALVFSLRIAAAAVLALLVAACDASALKSCLRAVAAAAVLVAALALLETLGVRALDGFLDRFRAAPFLLGASRRASAASESPNLAAALLGYGLVVAAGLAGSGRRAAWRAGGLALFLSLGLLCTYSRGGLLAALLGVAVVSLVRRTKSAAPAVVLAVVATSAAGFAAANPSFRERIALEERLSTHRARYQPAESSLALAPGEIRRLSVRVTNTGTGPWRPEPGFRRSCTWYSPGKLRDAGCRTPLPAPLEPGGSVTLAADVQAPGSPGRYLLVWEMWGELGRFAGLGVPPATVPALVGRVTGVAAPSLPTLLSDQSRKELWRLAFSMWRERPLLGFGPDNFRRMHASYAGWPFEDEVRSAHNTFLEVAATSGALGLAALLTTLVSSGAAARKMLEQPSPGEAAAVGAVLLGLLASITAHACVDHLLGFTAHYLLLGILVGAAASIRATATSPSAGS